MEGPDSIYESGAYLEQNPGWHEEDAPWKTRQILKSLHKQHLVPRTICDVGCGSGETIRELSRVYPDARCVGFEVSPDAFAIAAPKATDTLTFTRDDPFTQGQRFELACALDVFEHVDDYLGFLRRMSALAEWKVYHNPLDISVQTVIRAKPLRDIRKSIGHIHFFTKDQALATLEDTGHEVIDWFYTAGSIEAPSRSRRGRLLALPRKVLFRAFPDFTVRLLGGYSMLALCR